MHDESPEAVRPIGIGGWHLPHATDPRTLCGEIVQYGSRRIPWAETPFEDRCDTCLGVWLESEAL